ncbi:MAG: hypothetical protein IPG91_11490 [Ideonella sp.]|nr:hypothetical protein [Ideonella sp.]
MSEAIRRHGARNEWRPRDAAGFAALLVATALAPVTIWSKDRAGGALDLHDMGTLYVGGRVVESPTPASSGPPFILPPARGSRVADQSFVEYFVPRKVTGAPLVMVPGGSLLGSQYQTTPDGRPGWATRFVQRGHPTYLLEPANRGRAGLYADDINAALLGSGASPAPGAGLWNFIPEVAWPQFGLGTVTPGSTNPFVPATFVAHADGRFALAGLQQLAASFVPNRFGNAAAEVGGITALLERLGSAVLIGHSLGGQQVFEAALARPTRVEAIVAVEPVACPAEVANPPFTAADAERLAAARIPVLVIYGDHIEGGTPAQGYRPFQGPRRVLCRALAERLRAAGVPAQVISLPEDLGVRGNSHLMMLENNSDDIAELIARWLSRQ